MNDTHDLFASFHDVCSFIATVKDGQFAFSYRSEDFDDRFGSPATAQEWFHPDDAQYLAQDLEAFAYVRLLEHDNGYMPYFLRYLYADDTLSGICFPRGDNLLGFENLER